MTTRSGRLGSLIRAFVWLRWRLLVNSLRGGRRRDTLERISRATSALLPIALAIVFFPAFVASCGLAVLGGWALGAQKLPAVGILACLRILLGVVCVAVVLAPAARSIRTSSSGLSRFLLLPIPRSLLFVSDAAAGLLDPWIALVVPILLLFPLGLAAAGRLAAAAVAVLAGAAMLAAYVGLESSVSHLLRLLYRSRRRGEMATLVVLASLSMAGFIPLFVSSMTHSPRPHDQRAPAERSQRAEDIDAAGARDGDAAGSAATDRSHPPGARGTGDLSWVPVLPSELYGRTIDLAISGRAGEGVLTAGLLLAFAGALIGLAWTAHARLLDSPESGGRQRAGKRERLLGRRLPGLSSTTSALAIIHVRLLLRSVQGKMAIYFTPLSLVVFAFLSTRLWTMDLSVVVGDSSGPALATAGTLFSLLALQKIMVNQFAIDGAGLTLQLLAPISERDLVLGKAAGMGFLFSVSMVLYIVLAFAAAPGASPWLWPVVALIGASVYVLFAPLALMLSALFPRAADLSRMGKSGNPNQLAAFLGFLLIMVTAAPPLALAGAALLLARSPVGALVLVGGWTGVAIAVSIPLFRLCERVVLSRRENLGLTAPGR